MARGGEEGNWSWEIGEGGGYRKGEIGGGQEEVPAGHLPLPRELQAVTQGGGHRPPVWWSGVRIQE